MIFLIWKEKKRFFASLRMTMLVFGTASLATEWQMRLSFSDVYYSIFSCHPEAVSRRISFLIFWLEKKGRDSSLRSEWQYGLLEQSLYHSWLFTPSNIFSFSSSKLSTWKMIFSFSILIGFRFSTSFNITSGFVWSDSCK